jgi:hypothetical protein
MYSTQRTLMLAFITLALTTNAFAQEGPRLFLDIPNIYFTTPNAIKANERIGLGIETAFNVATHWSTLRIGGGYAHTADPRSNEVFETTYGNPYLLLEGGVGRYRSNGNKCARTHKPAYTAMLRAGLRYDFITGRQSSDDGVTIAPADGLDYGVGLELGNFYIRDVFKNYEFFGRGMYFVKSETIAAEIGFKLFLNLRADRD